MNKKRRHSLGVLLLLIIDWLRFPQMFLHNLKYFGYVFLMEV